MVPRERGQFSPGLRGRNRPPIRGSHGARPIVVVHLGESDRVVPTHTPHQLNRQVVQEFELDVGFHNHQCPA
jgi:hypothetical protein